MQEFQESAYVSTGEARGAMVMQGSGEAYLLPHARASKDILAFLERLSQCGYSIVSDFDDDARGVAAGREGPGVDHAPCQGHGCVAGPKSDFRPHIRRWTGCDWSRFSMRKGGMSVHTRD